MIELGDTESVTVGAGVGVATDVTVSVVVLDTVPPGPVHSRVYEVVTVGLTAVVPVYVPDTGVVPVSPPLAVQVVAFDTVHESDDALPRVIVVGSVAVEPTLKTVDTLIASPKSQVYIAIDIFPPNSLFVPLLRPCSCM